MQATAFHETGHAVVVWALGLRVGTIEVREEDAGGRTDIGPARPVMRLNGSSGQRATSLRATQITSRSPIYCKRTACQRKSGSGASR